MKEGGGYSTFGWIWFLSLLGSAVLWLALGQFENSTTIFPDRPSWITVSFVGGAFFGILSGYVGYTESSFRKTSDSVRATLAFGLMGAIAASLLLGRVSGLVIASFDFPTGETRTFKALMPIGRAYHGHSRHGGDSWIIQPTPLWTNIDISKSDWDFMAARRRSWDQETGSEPISSRGYFCASVTMQQSGDNLRVLNAGSHKLPQGSVGICPPEAKGRRFVESR